MSRRQRQQQTAVQQAVQQAAPQLKTVAMPAGRSMATENDVTMMSNGVGFHTGRFDVSFSGEVNGFYIHGPRLTPALCTSPACSANLRLIEQTERRRSVRSGLLPGDLSIKISTQEHGWDVAVFFGIWPAIQNNNILELAPCVKAACSGTVALGTPGIDFRQTVRHLGPCPLRNPEDRPRPGPLRPGSHPERHDPAGRRQHLDFGQGNVNPGNVTLGRIGVGYIYTDFMPQITYTTPSFHGLQGAFGVFQAYDDPFASSNVFTLRPRTADDPGQADLRDGQGPGQGQVLEQLRNPERERTGPVYGGLAGNGVRATGVDYGFSVSLAWCWLVGYGYNGWGLGHAGLLWDGIGDQLCGIRPPVLPRAITSSPATPTRSSSSATAMARAT